MYALLHSGGQIREKEGQFCHLKGTGSLSSLNTIRQPVTLSPRAAKWDATCQPSVSEILRVQRALGWRRDRVGDNSRMATWLRKDRQWG